MTVVVDVGCTSHGSDASIPHLIEEFRPTTLYGFDPAEEENSDTEQDGTRVLLRCAAAWTFDGSIGFWVENLGGRVDDGAPMFPCVDLARFINEIDSDDIVLKMDAEGAEYQLLPHLRRFDADLRLRLAIVEWHCEICRIGGNGRHREGCTMDVEWWNERRTSVEGLLRCETGEWNR